MLTRLEVKGFKNLLDIRVHFGPFTCIAGANGVGKSNVLDVIEFLSHLATGTLVEATQRVRGSEGVRGGDPRDLFWDGYRDEAREISLAAEMLVPEHVEDDLGAPAKAATTFLRYELGLGYAPPEGAAGVGRLILKSESLTHITQGAARDHLRFDHKQTFRKAVVAGKRSGGAFLSTEYRPEGTVINVHGDGGSRGKPQPRAATRAGRTVLSTVATNDYPTILAARREMQSWRRLALEPSALRSPDNFGDQRQLGSDGRHLAGSLYRIAHDLTDSGEETKAVYARVAGRLADLTGVGVDTVEVEPDQVREILTLILRERGGLRLPARALSEGTLRFLALCVLLEDPEVTGLICMEEPENGIHPDNLQAMIDLVRDLAVDPELAPGPENPFRQVIVNTHSPGVVQLCSPKDLLLAQSMQITRPGGRVAHALALLPFRRSWRDYGGGPTFTQLDAFPYLTPPPNRQLELPLDLAG